MLAALKTDEGTGVDIVGITTEKMLAWAEHEVRQGPIICVIQDGWRASVGPKADTLAEAVRNLLMSPLIVHQFVSTLPGRSPVVEQAIDHPLHW